MKWQGATEFQHDNKAFAEDCRVAAARANMEAAKFQREAALNNFFTYNIRMITGRSRALYAIKPGEGMFTTGATKVVVEVGYHNFPYYDKWSDGEYIEFYPWFLNYGTKYMSARPFHTSAMDETEPVFYDLCASYMADAFAKAYQKYGGPK